MTLVMSVGSSTIHSAVLPTSLVLEGASNVRLTARPSAVMNSCACVGLTAVIAAAARVPGWTGRLVITIDQFGNHSYQQEYCAAPEVKIWLVPACKTSLLPEPSMPIHAEDHHGSCPVVGA